MSLNKALDKLEAINKYWENKNGKRLLYGDQFAFDDAKQYMKFVRKEVKDVISIFGTLKYPGHKENQLINSCIDNLTESLARSERLFEHLKTKPDELHGMCGLTVHTWRVRRNLKRLSTGKLSKGAKKTHNEDYNEQV